MNFFSSFPKNIHPNANSNSYNSYLDLPPQNLVLDGTAQLQDTEICICSPKKDKQPYEAWVLQSCLLPYPEYKYNIKK